MPIKKSVLDEYMAATKQALKVGVCKSCHEDFYYSAAFRKAAFCSNACKQAHWLMMHNQPKPTPEPEKTEIQKPIKKEPTPAEIKAGKEAEAYLKKHKK